MHICHVITSSSNVGGNIQPCNQADVIAFQHSNICGICQCLKKCLPILLVVLQMLLVNAQLASDPTVPEMHLTCM